MVLYQGLTQGYMKFWELTPSDAVIMECRFGIESALSIFTITCMSAPHTVKQRKPE